VKDVENVSNLHVDWIPMISLQRFQYNRVEITDSTANCKRATSCVDQVVANVSPDFKLGYEVDEVLKASWRLV